MGKNTLIILSFLVLTSGIFPAFAEVTEIQLDKDSYFKGDSINVKGTVERNSSGLVTIVLRDPEGQFVLLSQSSIKYDNSFQQDIPIDEKFLLSGTYNATAFILDMTAAKTQSFNFDTNIENKNTDKNLVNISELEAELAEELRLTNIVLEPTNKVIENQIEEKSMNLPSQENTGESKHQVADFVDKTKKPEYYLDRYYNEPVYQSWFDRNYPNLTIEEAVGYTIPSKIDVESTYTSGGSQILPEAEAIVMDPQTLETQNNSDLAQTGLAVGGLIVLFGAVYGIKRKVDHNAKHISLNKDLIKRKLISPIIDSNPLSIIKTRLAKGEITIEEYEYIRQKIQRDF